MKLSNKANADLRKVLIKEVGADSANSFSDEELNKIGELLLTILSEGLKMKVTGAETSPRVFKQLLKGAQ